MAYKYCYNKNFNEMLFGEEKMKTKEDKRMIKLEFCFFSKTAFFGYM